MRFFVYVRNVDADCYPEGLARAVHFAYLSSDGVKVPVNKNYGILFAKGEISEKNTIVPMGVREPKIFAMEDGKIGICGERVLESGDSDATSAGKILLWTTGDLIHFEEQGLVEVWTLSTYDLAESLEIPDTIAQEAISYWTSIRAVACEYEAEMEVYSEAELDNVRVTVHYNDGSTSQKKVAWEKSNLAFGTPGSLDVPGRIDRPYFRFPLAKGYGDPVVFPWEGKWYYISTNDNLNDIGFYAREAETPWGLFTEGVTEHLILPFDPSRGLEQTFWAPEFHVIGGELYILFAVSGHAWGPQCHMMKLKKGGSIIDANAWEDPIRVVKKDGTPLAQGPITLDMTYVKAKSGSYVIWSYREHLMSPMDSGSMLFIASIDEEKPWVLTSEPTLLTRPLYGWENVSGTINNEGPYAFVKDGKVYVTYSGGAANGYTYALGLLTADENADLTKLASWHKSITPVLTFYSVEGEYGPGHNSFFKFGDDLMIAYHGETDLHDHLRCDGIRRVHFRANGEPYFQMSAQEDLPDELAEIQVKVVVK